VIISIVVTESNGVTPCSICGTVFYMRNSCGLGVVVDSVINEYSVLKKILSDRNVLAKQARKIKVLRVNGDLR